MLESERGRSSGSRPGDTVVLVGLLTHHTRRDPYVEVQQAVSGDADTLSYRVLSGGQARRAAGPGTERDQSVGRRQDRGSEGHCESSEVVGSFGEPLEASRLPECVVRLL